MVELVTAAAFEADVQAVWSWGLRKFGTKVAADYRLLIGLALEDIGSDPTRGRDRMNDWGRPVQSWHLNQSRWRSPPGRRIATPRHCIVYRREDSDTVLVLRLLRDGMDPLLHLTET